MNRKAATLRYTFVATIALLLLLSAGATSAREAGKVYLRATEIDAAAVGLPNLAAIERVAASNESGLWILHHWATPDGAARQAIAAAGGEILGYLPENAYLVKAETAALGTLSSLPGVDALVAYRSEWKLDPAIDRDNRAMLDLELSFAPGTDTARVTRAAAQIGAEVGGSSKLSPRPRVRLRALGSQLDALSRLPGLIWLSRAPELSSRNDNIKWACQSGIQYTTPIWDQGLHGEGQIVGHTDSGFDMSNCWFDDPDDTPIGPDHRKVVFLSEYTSGSNPAHGTHTAGTAAGEGYTNAGGPALRSLAYNAKLAHSDYLRDPTDPPFNVYDEFLVHYQAGARLHSNSWGDDGTTAYTTICADIDRFSWDYEESMVAFACTNTSTLKSPENAKNVLSVGASGSNVDGLYHEYSNGGIGPTDDGRRKPEIFAPGDNIVSARANNECWFQYMSGCSMACPAVISAAALVRQYFTEGWYPTGAQFPGNEMIPSGSLLRAVLLNSTVVIEDPAYPEYPHDQTGWGELVLDEGLHFANEEQQLWVEDIRNAQGLATGQEHTYAFNVHSANEPLRITLAFADYPGEIEAEFPVVNDINLIVNGPSNQYLGNVFDTSIGESTTGGSADPLNSVERVIVNAPEAGDWSITVSGAAVVMGTQGYGLSVSVNFAGTPVALSFFTAETVEGGVDLMWEILDGSDAADLRLMVDHDGASREVPFTQSSPDTYQAQDRHYQLRDGGRYEYSLFSREADQDWQLLRSNAIMLESAPFATALLGAFPNPFNPHTTVNFTLAEEQRARLTIFDPAGRHVALLADELFPSGMNQVDWSGKDDSGRNLASGVYFLRMEAQGFIEQSKLVLIR